MSEIGSGKNHASLFASEYKHAAILAISIEINLLSFRPIHSLAKTFKERTANTDIERFPVASTLRSEKLRV